MAPLRYLVAMMGFFALYSGFIYNDFLSLSFNLFGSCYNPEPAKCPDNPSSECFNPISGSYLNNECVYPFGLDPIWVTSENEIQFVNSMKMKMSVIFGVV